MYKFIFVFLFLCYAPFVYAEEIINFNSQLEVKKDGTVFVTENITYDFGSSQLHGILRNLKEHHPQKATVWYKKRTIGIDVRSVHKDGIAEPYVVIDKGTAVEIKIGNADIEVTGQHTYTIGYELTGALSYGPLGSELYYNVTGDNWPIPISTANAVVVDNTGTLIAPISDCYVGVSGDTTRCSKGITTATSSIFVTSVLPPGSGLTLAQELNAGSVAVLINEEISINWILYVFGVVWLFGLSIWAYRFRTAFKSNKPVIAQYEPFEGVLPMYTGVLFDGKLDPRDITAGIVYLAEQGFIKIRKTEEKVLWVFNTSDYEITLLQSMKDLSISINLTVLELFFGNYAAVGSKMKLSDLPSNKKTENAALIQNLKIILNYDLEAKGFIVSNLGVHVRRKLWVILPGLFVVVFMFVSEQKLSFVGLLLMILPLVILVLAFYNRRTQKGYDAKNHLKGFKLFLSVTEKERYKFFNAPDKSPELFMKYLPYAIALGVDQEWQSVFKDITIPNPVWYEGGSLGTFSAVAFSATDLTSDLSAFSNTLASSGVSGASGGGSSGGGGGGGGGGSW